MQLQARELNVCDTLKACYLVNIKTRNETLLDGFDSFVIDPTNEQGYTVRCDVNGVNESHFIKFMYNNKVHDEFGQPRYMFGSSDNEKYINKVDYLSTCGRKHLTIEGHVWSKKCFTNEFTINAKNPNGKPCASAPASNPVMAPAEVPVTAPVEAPVKAPVAAPLKAPVKAPVTAPVKSPLTPPATVCKPKISGFTLIDADLDEDIMPLANFTKTVGMLNIRADVAVCVPEVVDSVMLVLDGKGRCERHRPYSVFADDSSTDIANDAAAYSGETIGVGKHVITATPYTGTTCNGIAGRKYTQKFQVF